MGEPTSQSQDRVKPSPSRDRVTALRARARRRGRALPWSDASILVSSIVMVMLLMPVWVDPTALSELAGPPALVTPSLGPATQQPVAVQPPVAIPPRGNGPPTIVVLDRFSRVVSGGWGQADLGGAYTVLGDEEALAVADGTGTLSLPAAGTELSVFLGDVRVRDAEVGFSVAVDALPDDGAVFVYAAVRRTATGEAYRPKVIITSSGAVYAHAGVLRSDGESSVGRPALVPGLTVTAGTVISVRSSVTGSDPTTVLVRAWAHQEGALEPQYWNFGVIDWTGSLQGVGSIGLAAYVGVRHPGGPVRIAFDDLTATTTDLPGGSQ